jgi:hypothetical protein
MALQNEKDPLVVLDLVGSWVLPLSKATQVIALMATAERVEWDWSHKQYKSKNAEENSITVKAISIAQLAAIRLSDDTP